VAPVSLSIGPTTRAWTAASLLLIIPLGLASKFYGGPAANWVNNALSGAFYEIFWCLFVFLWAPRSRPLRIAVLVLSITCALEFLQLWHPPLLEAVRRNFFGRALIGSDFAWGDFPYYFLGSGVGWLWIDGLLRAGPGRAREART
jgi:hypothetical protein